MSQDLVSLQFAPADLDAVDSALAVLEAKLEALVTLTAAERRKAIKMGDKSEVFCRQTELVLRQNPGIVPSNFDLAGLQEDLTALDALRPRLQRLRALTDRADDTELALGSDILSASLDGYALAKVGGKGTALDTLKDAMQTRLSRKPRKAGTPAA
ncbi:MAG: hypothetical protein PHW25_16585 [Zoogloea sp.]|uniref:hypothetical protein n=1 Tax=Zoogloea sp. TaxID=49181 RepID=UPI002622E538|nr:hypothetical protein [Zoogloea sp.]MDD3328702.1 hypothetical protein [Zoogloea sp.]